MGGREGALSIRALEAACGAKVSRTLFGRIMAGEYDAELQQRTIDGLAEALQVSVADVEAAAGAPPSFGPFRLSENAARLTPTQRRAVKHVVEAMLTPSERQERGHLRAVAAGRRGSESEAGREARDKAAKARRDQEKP